MSQLTSNVGGVSDPFVDVSRTLQRVGLAGPAPDRPPPRLARAARTARPAARRACRIGRGRGEAAAGLPGERVAAARDAEPTEPLIADRPSRLSRRRRRRRRPPALAAALDLGPGRRRRAGGRRLGGLAGAWWQGRDHPLDGSGSLPAASGGSHGPSARLGGRRGAAGAAQRGLDRGRRQRRGRHRLGFRGPPRRLHRDQQPRRGGRGGRRHDHRGLRRRQSSRPRWSAGTRRTTWRRQGVPHGLPALRVRGLHATSSWATR